MDLLAVDTHAAPTHDMTTASFRTVGIIYY